jgi:hypothetical protein
MDEFHLFPKLSVEIQLKIWKQAAFIPRVVTVSCSDPPYLNGYQWAVRHLQMVFASPTAVPPMLSACFMARQVGLKYYQLTFGTREREAHIYLNLEVDTVYMKTPAVNWNDHFYLWHYACHFLTGDNGRLLKSIRSFAVDMGNIQIHESMQIAEMAGLRELLLIENSTAPAANYLYRAEPRCPNPARAFNWLKDALVRRRNKFLTTGLDPGLDARLGITPAPLTMRLLKLGEDDTSFVECEGVEDEIIENFPFFVSLPYLDK